MAQAKPTCDLNSTPEKHEALQPFSCLRMAIKSVHHQALTSICRDLLLAVGMRCVVQIVVQTTNSRRVRGLQGPLGAFAAEDASIKCP